MSYQATQNNPHFSEKFALLEEEVKKLGGLLSTPSADAYVWQLTIDARSVFFLGVTFPFNNAASHRLARDKLASYQVLQKMKLRVPKGLSFFSARTIVGRSLVSEDKLVESLPQRLSACFGEELRHSETIFVLKPSEASKGAGVLFCRGFREVCTHAASVFRWGHCGIVQEYLPGPEWRLIFLGEELLTCYQRAPADGIVATPTALNLSRGAIPLLDDCLPPAVLSLAQRAMRSLGLEFAGVDIKMSAQQEPVILELNSNPGFLLFRNTHLEQGDKVISRLARALVEYTREFGETD